MLFPASVCNRHFAQFCYMASSWPCSSKPGGQGAHDLCFGCRCCSQFGRTSTPSLFTDCWCSGCYWRPATEEICRRCGVGWFAGQTPAIPLGKLAALTATSLPATLLNPYTYDVYGAALKNFGRSALLAYLPELSAIGFRRPQDFALLLLAMLAFFSLGRRRSRDLFQFALMIVSAVLSFPAQRDSWLGAVAAVAVVGDALPNRRSKVTQEGVRPWALENFVTAGLVLMALWVAVVIRIPSSREALLASVGRTLPVRA